MANKPGKADTNKAEANKAIVVDEANKIAEAGKANVIVEIVLVDQAIAVDRADLANKADDIRSAKQDDNYGGSNIILPCPGS